LPEPLLPEVRVTHETLLAAVQAHPASEVTLKVPVPPVEPAFTDAGEMEYVQLAPAWVTVNGFPAIVRVPVRLEVCPLAATE
jgi:hypothetical protein